MSANVVDAASFSPATAHYQLLKKFEFGVDRNGQPQLPEFHTAREGIEALRNDTLSKDPAFIEKVRLLKS